MEQEAAMESFDPPLSDLDGWLLTLASGVTALIGGAVFLLLG
jgi:hypothetical protein